MSRLLSNRCPTTVFAHCGPLSRLSRSLFGWPSLWGDREKRLKARERKVAERGQGYYRDLQDFRKSNGKRFKAQSELIPKHKSVQFPKFTAPAIDGSSVSLPLKHPSLVLVHFRRIGQKMCGKYRTFFEVAELDSHVDVLELTCLDKWTFKMSQRWIEDNLRKSIPAEDQKYHLVLSGGVVGTLRADLEIHNGLVGYVFLVDSMGRIRWRAHAEPAKSEVEAMIKCTYDLVDRGQTLQDKGDVLDGDKDHAAFAVSR